MHHIHALLHMTCIGAVCLPSCSMTSPIFGLLSPNNMGLFMVPMLPSHEEFPCAMQMYTATTQHPVAHSFHMQLDAWHSFYHGSMMNYDPYVTHLGCHWTACCNCGCFPCCNTVGCHLLLHASCHAAICCSTSFVEFTLRLPQARDGSLHANWWNSFRPGLPPPWQQPLPSGPAASSWPHRTSGS